MFAPNLAWRDEPLQASGSRTCVGLPVLVENDANAAPGPRSGSAPARGHQDVVLLAVGTGIGGGLVLGGELYRGRWGMAGEPGHYRVVPDGRLCGCGNRGCWEQYASGSALVAEAREFARRTPEGAIRLLQLGGGSPEGIGGPQVTQAATGGRPGRAALLPDRGRLARAGPGRPGRDPRSGLLRHRRRRVARRATCCSRPARAAFESALTGRGYRQFADIKTGRAWRRRRTS